MTEQNRRFCRLDGPPPVMPERPPSDYPLVEVGALIVIVVVLLAYQSGWL